MMFLKTIMKNLKLIWNVEKSNLSNLSIIQNIAYLMWSVKFLGESDGNVEVVGFHKTQGSTAESLSVCTSHEKIVSATTA
jgi:hypothetical protein